MSAEYMVTFAKEEYRGGYKYFYRIDKFSEAQSLADFTEYQKDDICKRPYPYLGCHYYDVKIEAKNETEALDKAIYKLIETAFKQVSQETIEKISKNLCETCKANTSSIYGSYVCNKKTLCMLTEIFYEMGKKSNYHNNSLLSKDVIDSLYRVIDHTVAEINSEISQGICSECQKKIS